MYVSENRSRAIVEITNEKSFKKNNSCCHLISHCFVLLEFFISAIVTKKQLILLVGYKNCHQRSWLEMRVSGNNKYPTYGAAILNECGSQYYRICNAHARNVELKSLDATSCLFWGCFNVSNQSIQTFCSFVRHTKKIAILIALAGRF